MKKLSVLLSLLILTSLSAKATIAGSLKKVLEEANDTDYIRVMVFPVQQPDYENLGNMFKGDKKAEVAYLRNLARSTQKPILEFLDQQKGNVIEKEGFWIVNAIYVKAKRSLILKLAERDDVGRIELDSKAYLTKLPVSTRTGGYTESNPKVVYWNISKIHADSVWKLGYTGQGVVVGHIDTGVDTSHPALEGKFSGHFYDATQGTFPAPYDDHGHGTHTMGIILGGDGLGSFVRDIGVAPGATFASAKAFTSQGAYTSWITRSFQWFGTLLVDSGVNVRVINNSWGTCDSTSTTHWNTIWTVRSLGIIPVFSIGNYDITCPHIRAGTPGNYPTVIGVGATTRTDSVSSFSQRGPAPNLYPWNNQSYWSRPDWNFIKPDVVAPGQSIYSSTPGGSYVTWDGTSMAAPHITGVIALILSKNPALDYYQVYNILTNSAYQPSGYSFPNNDYGWGRVDALSAIEMTPSPNQPFLTLINVVVTDQNGRLDPGDTANIVIYITNLTNNTAQSTQGFLSTSSTNISILDSLGTYGDVSFNDTIGNENDPFTVYVDPNTPSGAVAVFTLHLTTSDSYTTDLDFSLPIGNPRFDYANIDTGNCILTVTDNGSIGYMTSNQLQGNGFVYPKNGENTLFYGSLAFGNDSSYVVDNWYEHGTEDGDWVYTQDPLGKLYYVTPPQVANQEIWGMMSDSGHPNPQGVTVEQIAYGFMRDGINDFVIIKYVFKNNGYSTLNDLYAAQFIDFDIGEDPMTNYAFVDTSRYTAFMAPSNYNPVVGITLLYPRDNVANISTISNPTYIYPDTGMTDANEWKFMSGQLHFGNQASQNDYSVVVSAGPFSLAPGEEDSVVFAIVGGTSFSAYYANCDSAYSAYIVGVNESAQVPGIKMFRISPNVIRSKGELTFTIDRKSTVKINLFDVSGRVVKHIYSGVMGSGTHTLKMRVDGLPSGIYFLELNADSRTKIGKFMIVK